jgi:hypothetical protein
MGKKASRAKHSDRLYNIVLRVKGSVKNDIMKAAERHEMTLNDYVLYCTWEHIRSERGIPAPGPSQFSLPDPMDYVRAYLSGVSVLMPCGKKECNMVVSTHNDMEFCDTCNVRIK